MELQHPLAVVTSSVDGDVLHVLASAHSSFSVPQLHRMIPRRSVTGIRNSVARLTAQGIVEVSGTPRSPQYALNDSHLAADPVRLLAGLRGALLERLQEHTKAWATPPVFGALFGSGARGTMGTGSDLDILLVRPADGDEEAWLDQVVRLTEAVSRWTGNDARVVDIVPEDTQDPTMLPLLDEVLRHGIAFAGDPLWLRRALGAKENV